MAGLGDGLVEFGLEEFFGGQDGEVFGDVDAAFVEFEEFDLFLLFSGAEDDAEGRLFVGFLFVFGEPAEVEFHLAFVFVAEVAEFEVDGDQAFEFAVVEEEVDVEVVVVDLEAFLAGDEAEACAEFEEELFDVAEDGVFEVFFEVVVVEVEEVEDVGIFEEEVGGDFLVVAELVEVVADGGFGFAGEGGAFVEHGVEALLELAG